REPAPDPWFEAVPDREPVRPPAALDPLPARSTGVPPPRLVAAAPRVEESEAERRERALHRAMAAPIGVAAFERGAAGPAARRAGPVRAEGGDDHPRRHARRHQLGAGWADPRPGPRERLQL